MKLTVFIDGACEPINPNGTVPVLLQHSKVKLPVGIRRTSCTFQDSRQADRGGAGYDQQHC